MILTVIGAERRWLVDPLAVVEDLLETAGARATRARAEAAIPAVRVARFTKCSFVGMEIGENGVGCGGLQVGPAQLAGSPAQQPAFEQR